MIERSPKGKERNIAKDAGLALATLVALGGLANLAVSSGKRNNIKERAGGKCESCGTSVSDADAIIGHMDHSARKDGRYKLMYINR